MVARVVYGRAATNYYGGRFKHGYVRMRGFKSRTIQDTLFFVVASYAPINYFYTVVASHGARGLSRAPERGIAVCA